MPKIRIEDAKAEYMRHFASRKLQDSTVRTTGNSLDMLIKVTGNIWLDKLDARLIDRVFATYPWQPSTCNTRLQVFRAFVAWARSRKYVPLDFDPLYTFKNLRVPQKQRTRIPEVEWASLFDLCTHPQERIVLATGLYLFLRASEQQRLQVKRVHLDDGEIEVWRVKTKQWDIMPITEELDEHLRAHMTWLADQGCCAPDHYLIPARNRDLDRVDNRWVAGTGTINPNKPLGKPQFPVQRILARAGYQTHGEGEHTLRRSGARAYFDQLSKDGYAMALRRVQSMLGHESGQTTEIYLGLDIDRFERNKALRGRRMFPKAMQHDNVVRIFREQ